MKREREKNGITQEYLAIALNVSTETIVGFEAGNIIPTASQLYAFCEFFDVSCDYIVGLTDMEAVANEKFGDFDLDNISFVGKKTLYAVYKAMLKIEQLQNK